MNQNLAHYLLLSACFAALFGAAELLYHFASVKAEYTRKLVHVGTGLLTMLFPLMFSSGTWVLCLCLSFLGLLTLSLKFNFLKSINAIDRVSAGSLLYPIIVIICFYFYLYKQQGSPTPCYYYFYLPILIMAVCDPIAALAGRHFKTGPYTIMGQTKTMAGSLGFFMASVILCLLILKGFEMPPLIITSLAISLVACMTEALSQKGYDNLLIPLSVISILCLCEWML